MKITGICKLERGDQAPWYMGYAWYNPLMDYTVILPIPFNHIAAIARAIYFRLRYIPYSKFDLHIANILRERFHEGYKAGYEDAKRRDKSDMVDAVAFAFAGLTNQPGGDRP